MKGYELLDILKTDQNVFQKISGIVCIDQIEKRVEETNFLIINIAKSSEKGIHWICAYSSHNCGDIELFDRSIHTLH